MTLRFPFALLAAGALALAACTGAAPSTPSPLPPVSTPAPATPAPSTPEPATPAPVSPGTATAEPGATGTPGALPTIPAEDPELAAMLPDTVGGLPLIKVSLRGEQFMPTAGEDFATFVEELGVDPAGITAATATGTTADQSQSIVTFALRLPGTTADQLLAAYSQAVAENQPEVTITAAELGGKNVFRMSGGGMVQPTYFHAVDEVFFVVVGSDETLAEEAIAQLP